MRAKDQAGFTLLEAMIAALILMVALVFLAQVFVTSIRQNRTSRQFTHATAIAQSKLEELNAMPIERLEYGGDLGRADGGNNDGLPGFVEYVAVDRPGSDTVGVVDEKSQANYVRYWKIEPDPDGWNGVFRITVRVLSLRAAQGNVREEVTLSTIRAHY